MGYGIKKTEHSGAKKGTGAYWGPKRHAKAGSKKARRSQGKREAREQDSST